jgi:hypothetical protein
LYKKTRSEESCIGWKEARNSYFHAIREVKTQHWHYFLAIAKGKDIFIATRYMKGSWVSKIPIISYAKEGYAT